MNRTRWWVAAMTCLALLLTGCSGGGSASTTFAPPPQTGLAKYLEKPPAGSVPGKTVWAETYEPSTKAFVEHFYGAGVQSKVRAELASQGLVDIAHVLWTTKDLVQADVVLMEFRDDAGAQARRNSVLNATQPDTTLTSYSMDDARGLPVVFRSKLADAQNNIRSRAYANYGKYFVEVFMFSPIQFEQGYLENWVRTQLGLLP